LFVPMSLACRHNNTTQQSRTEQSRAGAEQSRTTPVGSAVQSHTCIGTRAEQSRAGGTAVETEQTPHIITDGHRHRRRHRRAAALGW